MMQLNIFAKVDPLLKAAESKNSYRIKGFLSQHYQQGQFIYPDAVYRNLKINIRDIYEVLEFCVESEIVKQYLQIYCPFCHRFTGNCYETFFDIPEYINCNHCDQELEMPGKYAIIIYKVL